jgi:hypothetical protein
VKYIKWKHKREWFCALSNTQRTARKIATKPPRERPHKKMAKIYTAKYKEKDY